MCLAVVCGLAEILLPGSPPDPGPEVGLLDATPSPRQEIFGGGREVSHFAAVMGATGG
jgi:hypothetical protein